MTMIPPPPPSGPTAVPDLGPRFELPDRDRSLGFEAIGGGFIPGEDVQVAVIMREVSARMDVRARALGMGHELGQARRGILMGSISGTAVLIPVLEGARRSTATPAPTPWPTSRSESSRARSRSRSRSPCSCGWPGISLRGVPVRPPRRRPSRNPGSSSPVRGPLPRSRGDRIAFGRVLDGHGPPPRRRGRARLGRLEAVPQAQGNPRPKLHRRDRSGERDRRRRFDPPTGQACGDAAPVARAVGSERDRLSDRHSPRTVGVGDGGGLDAAGRSAAVRKVAHGRRALHPGRARCGADHLDPTRQPRHHPARPRTPRSGRRVRSPSARCRRARRAPLVPPVRGCADPLTAMIRARGLAAGTGFGSVENGSFWQGRTEVAIQCLLHAAALVAVLVEDIVETSRHLAAASPGARLDPPLLLALDDIANLSALPSLPTLMAEGGGSGITPLPVFQSLAQARSRWNENAATVIWDAAIVKIILGGGSHNRELTDISTLLGERDELTLSTSTDRGGGKSWQQSVRRVPIVPADVLRTLPFGTAIVLLRTARPIVASFAPWTSRPDADQLRADRAAVESDLIRAAG